jgi:hypothetical protein
LFLFLLLNYQYIQEKPSHITIFQFHNLVPCIIIRASSHLTMLSLFHVFIFVICCFMHFLLRFCAT